MRSIVEFVCVCVACVSRKPVLVSQSNQNSHEAGVKRIHALSLALSHPLSLINLSRLFEHSCAVSCMKENSRSSTQEVGSES